jgi:hypothetical protein
MRVSRIPLFSLGPARVTALLFISALLAVILGISPDGRLAVQLRPPADIHAAPTQAAAQMAVLP